MTPGGRSTILLLSPAYCGGRRAAILMKPGATSTLAVRLAAGTLSLGEAFTFMSGLYFRGKMAYAAAFGRNPDGPASWVITPTRGLEPPEGLGDRSVIDEFARVDIAGAGAAFTDPLLRDARRLADSLAEDARVVLLGSIATSKYLEVLLDVLGDRLCFPPAFIGRGDMSRGGLMLRSAASGEELEYVPAAAAATRRGPRPPRLPRLPRPPIPVAAARSRTP
jgi:hypothetical protein